MTEDIAQKSEQVTTDSDSSDSDSDSDATSVPSTLSSLTSTPNTSSESLALPPLSEKTSTSPATDNVSTEAGQDGSHAPKPESVKILQDAPHPPDPEVVTTKPELAAAQVISMPTTDPSPPAAVPEVDLTQTSTTLNPAKSGGNETSVDSSRPIPGAFPLDPGDPASESPGESQTDSVVALRPQSTMRKWLRSVSSRCEARLDKLRGKHRSPMEYFGHSKDQHRRMQRFKYTEELDEAKKGLAECKENRSRLMESALSRQKSVSPESGTGDESLRPKGGTKWTEELWTQNREDRIAWRANMRAFHRHRAGEARSDSRLSYWIDNIEVDKYPQCKETTQMEDWRRRSDSAFMDSFCDLSSGPLNEIDLEGAVKQMEFSQQAYSEELKYTSFLNDKFEEDCLIARQKLASPSKSDGEKG